MASCYSTWTLGVRRGTQLEFLLWSNAVTPEAVLQTEFRASEDCGTPVVRTAAAHGDDEGPGGCPVYLFWPCGITPDWGGERGHTSSKLCSSPCSSLLSLCCHPKSPCPIEFLPLPCRVSLFSLSHCSWSMVIYLLSWFFSMEEVSTGHLYSAILVPPVASFQNTILTCLSKYKTIKGYLYFWVFVYW